MSTDLPDPAMQGAISNQQSANGNTNQSDADGQTNSSTGGLNKERESVASSPPEVGGIRELGADIELPKEVAGVGVKVQPTTVSFPQDISQMKVPLSAQVPAATPAVVLPLTDEQIAQGLKQGISLSWRWLAEWCIRRLKQIHKTITRRK